jgi:uncharacterized protein (DUF1697 family)
MKYVAFFRNVNLGHPKSPTRVQLEAAFASSGAQSAQSFQTNGTLIFSADNEETALKVLAAACRRLESGCGLEEPAFLCGLPHLAKLVADDPFAGIDMKNVYLCCASFMPPKAILKVKTPLQSPRNDVEIVHVTSKTVLSLARKVGASPGSPTAFLEKILSVPVTTRTWNTILRLVKKHA